MNENPERPAVGQEDVVSAEIPERALRDVDELIALLERHAKAIIRMTAVLTKLDERTDKIERRLAAIEVKQQRIATEEVDVDLATLRIPSVIPPLALLADGRVLLHVSELKGLGEIDLSDRREWRGIMLTEAETSDVLTYLVDGISEASARVGGWIAESARRKKRDKPTDEEDGES